VRCCAGRVRKKGEMNGKSNNMNNVLQQIYPTGCYIPPDELIAVFDADQVPALDALNSKVNLLLAGRGEQVACCMLFQY
jgi:endoglucanase